ncbi:MAG TPA: NAD-dependent epimerase/dehydratase family protein [Anaerolineales bacterium]|nr:NAD-dependent epimerase/dehydratase family protein [Anaerolineales bacterium]
MRNGEKVVICCDYGISRSNSIAAGALAVYEGIGMDEAIRRVLAATGENSIKLDVLGAVRQAVESSDQRKNESHSILVTGASGFIGSSIVKKLHEQGQLVLAPSRDEIDLSKDALKLDILMKQRHVTKIVHFASPRIYTTNEALGLMLLMLKNVLDVCIQNESKFFYLSSWEIYSGYKAQRLLADETLLARPGGTYGQAKFLSEMLIRHFIQFYGMECTILRSGPVYGVQSDRPRFIWNFLSKARNDKEIVTHQYLNGFPVLDLLHIDDLQAAILDALKNGSVGEFNIGNGTGISTAEVARLLVEKTGSHSNIRHQQIEDYTSNIVMDYARANRVLGWRPAISISQGLDQLIQAEHSETR